MSGATTPPAPAVQSAPAAQTEPTWAKPGISIYALTIFVIAFGIAYMSKNDASLTMMMGAAISMGTSVVNYYLGSSSGSAQKTAIMSTPVTPPPGTTTTTTAVTSTPPAPPVPPAPSPGVTP